MGMKIFTHVLKETKLRVSLEAKLGMWMPWHANVLRGFPKYEATNILGHSIMRGAPRLGSLIPKGHDG
jgi:hypothetical protein